MSCILININSYIVVILIPSKLNQYNILANVIVTATMLNYIALLFLASIVTAANARGQGLYKVWLENVKPCDNDLNPILDLSSIKVSHHNRTAMALQGAAKLLETITNTTMLRVVIYMRSGHGAWVKTLVDTKDVSVCNFIKNDQHWYPALVQISDLPTDCPVQKGEFHFEGATLELKNMPPILPKGCFKIVINMWTDSLKSCENVFAKVTGPNGSPTPRCTS